MGYTVYKKDRFLQLKIDSFDCILFEQEIIVLKYLKTNKILEKKYLKYLSWKVNIDTN